MPEPSSSHSSTTVLAVAGLASAGLIARHSRPLRMLLVPCACLGVIVAGGRASRRRHRVEDALVDEAGSESFPASDPPAWTSGSAT